MTNDTNEWLIDIVTFHQFMFDNVVPIEDIDDFNHEPITKMLPYWRKNDLLPFIPKGLHFNISFAELIWIRILDTLRKFSYPVEKTRKVCDYFFKDAYEGDLPEKNLKNHQKNLNLKKKTGTISPYEEHTLDYIETSLKDEVLLYLLKYDINYLTNLTINCIREKEEIGLFIFSDGRVGEISGDKELNNHRGDDLDLKEPHIYLSLTYFLREFINSEELSEIFIPQILNEKERKVLKEMKNKNVKEISIVMNNGSVQKIKSTKDGMITGAKADEIRKILGLKNYQQITIDTRDETTIAFKKTYKNL